MALSYTKLSAWLIVIAGLSIIGWTVFSSYDFFIGQKKFPQVFKPGLEQVERQEEKSAEIKTMPADPAQDQAILQSQMQQAMMENVAKLFPADSIFQFLNMTSWIAFATFLVFAGSQIAGIGIKLLENKV